MTNQLTIRNALETDRDFIFELSPDLAQVAGLPWHSHSIVQKMQDDYINEMLEPTSIPQITLIAQASKVSVGFIHARAHKDGISGEACATVPLLAVSPAEINIGHP